MASLRSVRFCYIAAVGFTVTFPTNREAPIRSVITDWLRQRGEPFVDEAPSIRLRAMDLVLHLEGDALRAHLQVSSQLDLTRVVDLVFELSILVGADVNFEGHTVRRGQLWLLLADEQDRLRIKEALERAEVHGRREEVAQRLWQIVSAVRPGHDDRWDATNHRIVELLEIGDGVTLEEATEHTEHPEVGELLGLPILTTSMHVLAWRWLSEAYPGLAEAEHTFH